MNRECNADTNPYPGNCRRNHSFHICGSQRHIETKELRWTFWSSAVCRPGDDRSHSREGRPELCRDRSPLDDPGCGRFLSICLRRVSFPDSRKVVGSAGYADDSIGLVCFCLWPMAGTSQMIVTVRPSVIARIRWYEYASRFIVGGLATAVAGVIAKEYGPSIGGLFLAFPAIFPTSATLIEQHEKRRKQRTGGHGTLRGRKAAALDAAGASIGAFGLLTFACLAWKLMPDLSPWATLSIATLGWLAVSMLGWKLWHIF